MKTNSYSIMNKTTFLNVTFELWDQVLGIIATNNHKFQGPLQVLNFYELKFESRRKTFYFLTQNRVVERIFNQIYHQWSISLTLSTNCQRTITCSIRWNCPLLSFFFPQAHAVVVTAAMFAPVPWLIVPPDSSVHQTTTEVLVTADWSGAIKLFVNRWHAAALIWNIGGNCLAGLESPRHVVIQILCLTWWSTQIVNGNYETIFFAYPRRTPVYSDVVSFAVYSALVLSFLYLARGTVVRWVMGRGLREMTSISLSVAVTLPVVPRAPLLILLAAVAIKT